MSIIVCIGAAAIDRKYTVRGRYRMGTSNPASSRRGFGGVARNVAENLARLGVDVGLVSIVGVDHNALLIRRHLTDAGVDTSHLIASHDHPTAEYVAILESDGKLALAVADMDVFDDFSPAHFEDVWPHLAEARWVFADCNLPMPILASLIERRRDGLAIDAVSVPKVQRLPRTLGGSAILFLNQDEANAYLRKGEPENDPQVLAHEVRERGAAAVVLTSGERGAVVAEADGEAAYAPLQCTPIDETGAGDALVAGTLAALIDGEPARSAVRTGMLLATLTLESEATVHPMLSRELLRAHSGRLEQRSAR